VAVAALHLGLDPAGPPDAPDAGRHLLQRAEEDCGESGRQREAGKGPGTYCSCSSGQRSDQAALECKFVIN